MRYIDFAKFKPSAGWMARSQTATQELLQKQTHEDRMKYIKDHAQVWRDLRNELIGEFGSRCWFTDAEEAVAQLDTEHFRPKAVALDEDETPHEGYWWLAFEVSNLRLAGQVPNRQYKKCFFPLLAGCHRATSHNKRWQEELPVFLDPVRITDVELVGYNETGSMCPSLSADSASAKRRVELTDRLLGLSIHPPLIEARQRIWSACRTLIDEIIELKEEERVYGETPRTCGERERLMTELRKKCQASEPMSSVAKCCLLMSGHPWARTVATSC